MAPSSNEFNCNSLFEISIHSVLRKDNHCVEGIDAPLLPCFQYPLDIGIAPLHFDSVLETPRSQLNISAVAASVCCNILLQRNHSSGTFGTIHRCLLTLNAYEQFPFEVVGLLPTLPYPSCSRPSWAGLGSDFFVVVNGCFWGSASLWDA